MRATGAALRFLLAVGMPWVAGCDGKPLHTVLPATARSAPREAVSASATGERAVSAPPNQSGWEWPVPNAGSSFSGEADHPYHRLLRLMRTGRDRVLMARSGWRWLGQHGSEKYVSNFAQAAGADERSRSTMIFRLRPTPDNQFDYVDDRFGVAVRTIDSARAAELVELLAELSDGGQAGSLATAPVPVRMLLQRELWQLAAAIAAGVTHVEPSRPVGAALRTAMVAASVSRDKVAAVAPWVQSPWDLPAGVREPATGGWVEWSTKGHQHTASSQRTMPFEEPVYGVWRTFVRFPSTPEGATAKQAFSAALAAAPTNGARTTRAHLRENVLIDGKLPRGTELAATVHLIHLAEKLEPIATNALLRVLYRRLRGEQQYEEHELSRASVLDAGPVSLIGVAAEKPRIQVLAGAPERAGLMVASNAQTCHVCHDVATHKGEGLGRAPLSWVLGGRAPLIGSPDLSVKISLESARNALSGLLTQRAAAP